MLWNLVRFVFLLRQLSRARRGPPQTGFAVGYRNSSARLVFLLWQLCGSSSGQQVQFSAAPAAAVAYFSADSSCSVLSRWPEQLPAATASQKLSRVQRQRLFGFLGHIVGHTFEPSSCTSTAVLLWPTLRSCKRTTCSTNTLPNWLLWSLRCHRLRDLLPNLHKHARQPAWPELCG